MPVNTPKETENQKEDQITTLLSNEKKVKDKIENIIDAHSNYFSINDENFKQE